MDGPNEFEWLKKYSSCFVVDSNNVKVLKEPSEFYSLLKVSNKNNIYFLQINFSLKR